MLFISSVFDFSVLLQSMGCVLGKCCTCNRYTASSESDMAQFCDASPCGSRGKHILTGRSLECVRVPSHNYYMEYSLLTQRGYYPDSPDKGNQDSVCVSTKIRGNPNIHFFGVFDGHGQYGSECSNFVKERVVQILCKDSALSQDPVRAYNAAFFTTNDELHKSKIDDSLSGTTAITVLVVGNMLYVANVGDSRAVIAVKDGNRIIAKDMSNDQTPFRKDECERVKLAGATVMTIDQIEGHKDPGIQIWGDEESQGNDPPRLWLPNSFYPGTAFTRSVGDSTAEKIGVTAVPEISVLQLTQNHLFFVVASDGVFEFLTSQAIVDMVRISTQFTFSFNVWLTTCPTGFSFVVISVIYACFIISERSFLLNCECCIVMYFLHLGREVHRPTRCLRCHCWRVIQAMVEA